MSGNRCVDTVEESFVGEEAALSADTHLSTAVAVDDCVLFAFPKTAMQSFLQQNPKLSGKLYQSLINHCSDRSYPFQLTPNKPRHKRA